MIYGFRVCGNSEQQVQGMTVMRMLRLTGGNIKDIEYEMNTSVKSWRQLPLRIMKRLN